MSVVVRWCHAGEEGKEPYSLTPSGIFPAAAVYSQEKERGREGGRKEKGLQQRKEERTSRGRPEKTSKVPPESDEKMAWESQGPISQAARADCDRPGKGRERFLAGSAAFDATISLTFEGFQLRLPSSPVLLSLAAPLNSSRMGRT